MKYRIKDHELQRKLDEATDGEFSRRLQNDRERMDGMILIGCMGMIEDRRRHNHTKLQRMTLCFATDEIEEVAEYDPHKWNEYPEVTPPEGVWMRCETDLNAIEHKIRHVAKFDGREWRDYLSKQVVVHRFRSWDNPEDDE